MPADTTTTPGADDTPVTDKTALNERRSGWRTIRKVAPYLWPSDPPWVKKRVVAAMALLILSKLISVTTPFFYKGAVDALAEEGVPLFALGAVGLTVAYGVARLMTVGFQQLRDVVFARVGQRALRMLALETFGQGEKRKEQRGKGKKGKN